MNAALDFFDPKIAGVVKSGVFLVCRTSAIENGVSVARFVEQQLRPGIKGDQKILIRVVTGLNKLR